MMNEKQAQKWVQFYVMLKTIKIECSFRSCPGRKPDAVLRRAQDGKGKAKIIIHWSSITSWESYGFSSAHRSKTDL